MTDAAVDETEAQRKARLKKAAEEEQREQVAHNDAILAASIKMGEEAVAPLMEQDPWPVEYHADRYVTMLASWVSFAVAGLSAGRPDLAEKLQIGEDEDVVSQDGFRRAYESRLALLRKWSEKFPAAPRQE